MFSKQHTIWTSNRFLYSIAAFGVIVRLTQYLSNRSLWVDEAMLSLNIINKSFSGLCGTLDDWQVAPIGFLMFQKSAVLLFGNNEYILRLLPLLAGIISVFLFIKVAKYILSPNAVPVALLLFVTSKSLIYYSSEAKQYSTDVMTVLLLLLVSFYIMSTEIKFRRLLLFGILAAVAVWFSSPAVLVLGAIGTTWVIRSLMKKDWSKTGQLIFVFSLCLASVVANYIMLRNNANIFRLRNLSYWDNVWMPFPPLSFSDIYWFWDALEKYFRNPCGFTSSTYLAIICFLAGFLFFFRNKRDHFLISALVAAFTLIFSGLHFYPSEGRLLLFTLPFTFLILAEGIELIRKKLWLSTPLAGVCLVGLLLMFPTLNAAKLIFNPISKDEIRPVLEYLKDHKQNGDIIYVYSSARCAFEYYSERYGFDDYVLLEIDRNMKGQEQAILQRHIEYLNTLQRKARIWIVFTNVHGGKPLDNELLYVQHLDQIGSKLDCFRAKDSAVYLYDLSSPL